MFKLISRSVPSLGTLGGTTGKIATALLASAMLTGVASAAPSVTWGSPAEGTTFNVGSLVNPTGNASGSDGAGLDLAIVLDASTSMRNNATAGGVTKTRMAWQADAAIALVNSLPSDSTAVALIRYGTVAGTQVVLNLTPTTSAADIVSAIQAVEAIYGSTAIGTGITTAQAELTGPNATAGRSKQMVVISDGSNNAGTNPVTAAAAASEAGIVVHGVVIPGGNITTMQNIANAGGGIFANFTSAEALEDIERAFSEGGLFAGLERLDLTLPDGTVLENYATDAFGNFTVNPAWAIFEGANQFVANALFRDGSTASATLTLFGRSDSTPPPVGVPTPGVGMLFLGGLGLLGLARRRRNR